MRFLPEKHSIQAGHSLFTLKEIFENEIRSVYRSISEMDLRGQQRFDAQTKSLEDALIAAKEAVLKAEVATEKRFDGVTAFRENLADLTGTMMPRTESDAQAKAIYAKVDSLGMATSEKIAAMSARLDKNEGSSTSTATMRTTMIAIAAIVVTVIIGGASYLAPRPATDQPYAATTTRMNDIDRKISGLAGIMEKLAEKH